MRTATGLRGEAVAVGVFFCEVWGLEQSQLFWLMKSDCLLRWCLQEVIEGALADGVDGVYITEPNLAVAHAEVCVAVVYGIDIGDALCVTLSFSW